MILHRNGGDSASMSASGKGRALLSPSERETYLIELPSLSLKDAEKAARFKARALYPGPVDEATLAQRLFKTSSGYMALIHVAHKAEGYPRAVPHDFPHMRKGREQALYLFFSDGWIEWMVSSPEGIPQRIGIWGQDKDVPLTAFIGALPASVGIEAWCPELLIQDARALLTEDAVGGHPCQIRTYESNFNAVLHMGINSFGPRSPMAQGLRRFLSISLWLIDLAMIVFLLWRGVSAEEREYAALSKEKARLSLIMTRAASLKAEVDALTNQKNITAPAAGGSYRVIESLARYLPTETILKNIEVDGMAFRLSGTSSNAYDVVPTLEKSEAFTDLSLDQVSSNETGKRVNFEISGKMLHDKK